ncbi:NAD(P)H-dependent FMN reductase [Sphingomonas kyeonggiensis]|uniref:NAD(P)H-dependent FMN reductase n=1 Tax=Sphingomonas kyeonggiensis TaxID=1268553 RepID=A0A7W6NWU3_9SPHN|nr:NAD(P)H-dependent FMN reductase [Sphingomonas kyeonggiensis]
MSAGTQSFNSANTLRLLGRWMRMFTIHNKSSVAMAYKEFGDDDRMRPPSYYDSIVEVMEELVRMTVLMRPRIAQLVHRYSERKEGCLPVAREDHSAIAIGRQNLTLDDW